MKVVVDTNVVFSATLNSNGLIGELLFNSEEQFDFYSSEFIIDELTKYKSKLLALTKMTEKRIGYFNLPGTKEYFPHFIRSNIRSPLEKSL